MRNLEKDEIEMAARKELMLETGFRIFARQSIETVSMQEIAKACGLGVATLYRYFNTKLIFVIAIGARQWEDFGKRVIKAKEKQRIAEKSAARQLEFYLDFYLELYHKHKDLLRFNQNFNNFVLHEKADAAQLKPYLDAIALYSGLFHGVYEKGKQDGTIHTDLSEEKMFAATSHIMLAVIVRYAQGLVFSADVEADRTQELELLKRMLLREFVTE